MSKPPPGKRKPAPAPDWRITLNFGMEVMGGLVGMGLLGWWADRKFGTTPWLISLGLALAFFHTIWTSLKLVNGGKNPLDKLLNKPTPPTDTQAKPDDPTRQDQKQDLRQDPGTPPPPPQ